MKKAIKYLRFSSDNQSNFSIERQEIITSYWEKNNDIHLLDTFIDDGYSATNFDRPDIKELFAFIKKYYREIDYLIVAELTRFSREAGDAINMIKEIQTKYNIRIVSASKGMIYDILDSNSFFMMGIEFLLGNTENIKRKSDINGGIYTAKMQGKYIGSKPPYGYKKQGNGKDVKLIIDMDEAKVILHIFNKFLAGVPVNLIRDEIKQKMNFSFKSDAYIHKILRNPLYAALQYVNPWNNQPGGLVKAIHNPIIDIITWQSTQDKINDKGKQRIVPDNTFPLRGALRCYCGHLVTGAASKGKFEYFDYYKCNHGKSHNNFSAKKAHNQIEQVMDYLSLSSRITTAISSRSNDIMEQKLLDSKKSLLKLNIELSKIEANIKSTQEKFINQQLDFEAYNYWNNQFATQRRNVSAKIEELNKIDNQTYFLLKHNIEKLNDIKHIYTKMNVSGKQEFINLVFDRKLYYEKNIYRTPFILKIFADKLLILREKRLLELDSKGVFFNKIPQGGAEESRTPVQT